MSKPHVSRVQENGVAGVQPLTARWEPWMVELTADADRCATLVREYGSPVHVHHLDAFERNVTALRTAADQAGVDLGVYFARKANKCVSYVDAAGAAGTGVDVASVQELEQTLARGIPPSDVIVTSAVKPRRLLELCVDRGVCVAIDNDDEAVALSAVCRERDAIARIAIRLHGFTDGRRTLDSRFGLAIGDVPGAIHRWAGDRAWFELDGLHFHLDGYSAADRVVGLDAAISLADQLTSEGHTIRFIDIGGGFPMSYLDDPNEWNEYWRVLEAAIAGSHEPITYRNHGFGLHHVDGRIIGAREAYPHAQTPVGGEWLSSILDDRRPSAPATTVAEALRVRGLRLHCEPGRALLDGCGLTLARVEHRKLVGDDWLIGLHMNSSNCRSRKSELFADPRLVAARPRPAIPMTGFLTGAYCTESDLIMHRRLHFPTGVAVGDIIAFPNTAGYLMHFIESRSHLFDLPLNVVIDQDRPFVDPIDDRESRPSLTN